MCILRHTSLVLLFGISFNFVGKIHIKRIMNYIFEYEKQFIPYIHAYNKALCTVGINNVYLISTIDGQNSLFDICVIASSAFIVWSLCGIHHTRTHMNFCTTNVVYAYIYNLKPKYVECQMKCTWFVRNRFPHDWMRCNEQKNQFEMVSACIHRYRALACERTTSLTLTLFVIALCLTRAGIVGWALYGLFSPISYSMQVYFNNLSLWAEATLEIFGIHNYKLRRRWATRVASVKFQLPKIK